MKNNLVTEKSITYRESDAAQINAQARPILDERIGRFPDRLSQAIGDDSLRSFASKASISDGTLRNILNGAMPRMDILLKISDVAKVTIQWLVTGEGPKWIMTETEYLIAIEFKKYCEQHNLAGLKARTLFCRDYKNLKIDIDDNVREQYSEITPEKVSTWYNQLVDYPQYVPKTLEYKAKERESYLHALLLIEDVLQGANVDIKPNKKVELVKLVAQMIENEGLGMVKPQLLQLVALAS